jgi:hypothetical protein
MLSLELQSWRVKPGGRHGDRRIGAPLSEFSADNCSSSTIIVSASRVAATTHGGARQGDQYERRAPIPPRRAGEANPKAPVFILTINGLGWLPAPGCRLRALQEHNAVAA